MKNIQKNLGLEDKDCVIIGGQEGSPIVAVSDQTGLVILAGLVALLIVALMRAQARNDRLVELLIEKRWGDVNRG